MNILTLIDSFKGTISSIELGDMISNHFKSLNHNVTSIPISDGGEGLLDTMEYILQDKVERKYLDVYDPLFRKINTYYLIDKVSNTCYIEMAKASGIGLLTKDELNPFIASTYGFGELIKDAISSGFTNIVLGIGGSATNDCGAGMLEALGVKFYDNDKILERIKNKEFYKINRIEKAEIDAILDKINVLVLSDVTNPLLGKNGATNVFSPQKGAKEADLSCLEKNNFLFANFYPSKINLPGSGAAGGVGYALATYLDAKVVSGINYILDLIDYKNMQKNYDIVITGEGKFDSQSLGGKVVSQVIKNTSDRRVIILCAINEINTNDYEVYSVVDDTVSPKDSLSNPKYYFNQMLNKIKL